MKGRLLGLSLIMLLFVSGVGITIAQQRGLMKKRVRPDEYGNVIINNFSEDAGMNPVVFKHWLHRAYYTCKACHVDIGFAMEAGATGIKEKDNKRGFYCGACHNGKIAFAAREKKSFGPEKKNCNRCHSEGIDVPENTDFFDFVDKMNLPRDAYGNRVNWALAIQAGRIKPKDTVEGFTVPKRKIKLETEEVIEPKFSEMPDVVFPHKLHSRWNGCDMCHPDIFDVKAKGTKFTMEENFKGRFCGACHGKVSFPLYDCARCHSKMAEGAL